MGNYEARVLHSEELADNFERAFLSGSDHQLALALTDFLRFGIMMPAARRRGGFRVAPDGSGLRAANLGSALALHDPRGGGTSNEDCGDIPGPLLTYRGDGVPLCSHDACPHYDGKRCDVIGFRPSVICEPAVIQLVRDHEQCGGCPHDDCDRCDVGAIK